MPVDELVQLQALRCFEGFGDGRDEIWKIVRFFKHGNHSRLMGLPLYLVGDVSRIQNKGNSVEMRVGFHLKEKFQAAHDGHVVIGNDEIHLLALLQPSERGGTMFGFVTGIPMVLQKELQCLPGHLMIIDEENAFHVGRAAPFYKFLSDRINGVF